MPIRVLVVDDHPLVRHVLKDMLSKTAGMKWVGEAESGEEGEAQALKLKPEVILMDVSMAGMDGMETTKRIRKELPETKVIALTIHDDSEIVRGMMKAGAEGYVVKGTSENDILGAIFRVVEGRRFVGKDVRGRGRD